MIRSLCLVFALLLSSVAYADVTKLVATVDKNPVMLDEAITLTVIATGDADREDFDSTPLLKDFVVGRTSVSSQTQIINFDTTRTTSWTTTLFPQKTGEFTIPPFTIGGKRTQPITLKVIPVPKGNQQATRDYYVTTEVDTSNVYLQQQIRYTVKLFLANQIERGSLQSPELENAIIQQVGDDKQYSDIVNGKRYNVFERTFAIIPQQSGDFTIKGPVFSGEIVASNTNQRFGFFNRTEPLSRIGPEINISVKPIPTDIDYPWFPSEFVQLNEEWPDNVNFTVGEPVTRTITLSASGLQEEQLPDIPQRYPPDFKQYPDQSKTASAAKQGTLLAQRVVSVALIPTRAGNFVLPEVSVPWFNVKTGKTEYATIPPKSVVVAPASADQQNTAALPTTTPATEPAASQPEVTPSPTQFDINNLPTPPSDDLHRTATWILAGLWLLTLCGWSATVFLLQKTLPRDVTFIRQCVFLSHISQ